jgi:hypothetical protein
MVKGTVAHISGFELSFAVFTDDVQMAGHLNVQKLLSIS